MSLKMKPLIEYFQEQPAEQLVDLIDTVERSIKDQQRILAALLKAQKNQKRAAKERKKVVE